MKRQINFNIICIGIGVCVLCVLAGYRCLNDIVYLPNPDINNQTLDKDSRTDSENYIDAVLNLTRMMIKIQMWNYNYSHSGVDKLEDLVEESGGNPIRSIVVSTWRSGSSFLGDLINAVPSSFYSYEPLMMFNTYKQIRGPPNAARATKLIRNILKCDFNNETDFEKYFTFAKKKLKNVNQFSHNKRLWDKCTLKRELCFNAAFMTKFCKLFPFQAMKLDRFRLPLVKNIFEDNELNVKAVLLIRDPRAVMQSRRHIKDFCSIKKVPDCELASSVCSDMIIDYKAAANLMKQYPDRLMVLRFEDLALNLKNITHQLLKFLGLEPTKSVHEFLITHSTVSTSQSYSTFRVTKNIPFKWRKAMKFNAVNEIQETCKEAMSLWGYEPAHNASHMLSKKFKPLSAYSII